MLPMGTTLQGGTFLLAVQLSSDDFGVTYRATHIQFRKTVVIQEYLPRALAHRDTKTGVLEITGDTDAFEQGMRMFLREGELLCSLQHPNIVRVTDVFQELGTAYLVMEFLPGKDLATEICQTGQQGVSDARIQQLMGALVSALAAIHARDICHLDIKPDNLICLPDGTIKLINFGTAKQYMKRANPSHFSLTSAFAPPELFDGDFYGPESDIYEAGMLLHLLVTGSLPPALTERLAGRDAFQPQALRPPYGALIEEATRLDRRQRPSSVTEWWESGVHPVSSVPVASWEKMYSRSPVAVLPPPPEVQPLSLASQVILFLCAIVLIIISLFLVELYGIIILVFCLGDTFLSMNHTIAAIGICYFINSLILGKMSFGCREIFRKLLNEDDIDQVDVPEWTPNRCRNARYIIWNLRILALASTIIVFITPRDILFISALLSVALYASSYFYARWVRGQLRPR